MEEHAHTEETHSNKTDSRKQQSMPQLTVPSAIVLNALIIGASIIIAAVMLGGHFTTGAGVAKDDQAQQPTVTADIKNVKTDGAPFVGNPQAKVALAYWSDYQCPFCKQFETRTFQSILKDYVQSGKVAIVFKDFSFLGDDSDTAAEYGHAMWDLYPDKYFAWREAMYNAQDGENTGFGNEASIVKLTATVPGVDAGKVQKQVSTKKDIYQKMIEADKIEGASMGIQGTPSFITGKKLISGNNPYTDFQKALDAQLK
ncbi:MAG: thioredoxin domain-containing protein [bacterium]